MESIRHREVLHAVLMLTLAEQEKGVPTAEAYDSVGEQFTFPEAWYRQIPKGNGYDTLKEMGYDDWRDIPQEKLVELVRTEPQWQNELRWSRKKLNDEGYLDASAPRAVWRLTPAGLKAARNLKLDVFQPAEREIIETRKKAKPKVEKKSVSVSGSLRDDLRARLDVLIASMPLTDLELLVDIARTVRSRSISSD